MQRLTRAEAQKAPHFLGPLSLLPVTVSVTSLSTPSLHIGDTLGATETPQIKKTY
jgi:hypothetical protein